MSTDKWVGAAVCAVLAASTGVAWATSPEPRGAWLMKNYRFTGAPPPRLIKASDPVVSDLREVQNTVLSIMHKADFVEDYGTALSAATVAAANAQLIEAMTESTGSANTAIANSDTSPYSIECRGRTAEGATWSDGLMQHYVTPQGTHLQVRLDLVGHGVPTGVNRAK